MYAPALPGFGGTSDLPVERRTIEGYAAWVEAFLGAVGIDEPVLLIGHSFGGGVAIRVAHDAPTHVRQLVLINSVGHPAGSRGPALDAAPSDRPMWQYGAHFAKELFWSLRRVPHRAGGRRGSPLEHGRQPAEHWSRSGPSLDERI